MPERFPAAMVDDGPGVRVVGGLLPAVVLGMAVGIGGSSAAAGTAVATDGPAGELAELRQQLQALQRRVEMLEARLEAGVPVNMATRVEPIEGGWREPHNWQLLDRGLDRHRLRELLGDPEGTQRIGKFQVWHYPNGEVKLYLGRVKSWTGP